MPKKIKHTSLRLKAGRQLQGVKPEEASAELDRIRGLNGNLLTPRAVWENSRKASALLHQEFTWDDSEAGALYRDEEARRIIRQIEIVDDSSNKASRAWCHVVVDDETGYMPIGEVLVSEVLREQVLAEIMAMLQQARKRLSDFEGFSIEIASLDRVITRLEREEEIKPKVKRQAR